MKISNFNRHLGCAVHCNQVQRRSWTIVSKMGARWAKEKTKGKGTEKSGTERNLFLCGIWEKGDWSVKGGYLGKRRLESHTPTGGVNNFRHAANSSSSSLSLSWSGKGKKYSAKEIRESLSHSGGHSND